MLSLLEIIVPAYKGLNDKWELLDRDWGTGNSVGHIKLSHLHNKYLTENMFNEIYTL